MTYPIDGVPAYLLVNTSVDRRYRVEKDIIADPRRDVVLQQTRFVPLQGKMNDYHLYVLLAPHLANHGAGNTAWVGDYKGVPMLFAERVGSALALACSAPWLKRTVGFVGTSDAWQDLMRHKSISAEFTCAENGNVAMAGEVDIASANGTFLLALGFGSNASEAGNRALASLYDGFESSQKRYTSEWQAWQRTLPDIDGGRAAMISSG